MKLTIGSRGSNLALWQANHVRAALEANGHECRIEIISTSGDRIQHVPLKEVGNKGLFTKEIEEALLDGRIDVAVHSLKDMPTRLPDKLRITATPVREDARDVMIGCRLVDLAEGAHVGTGSLRRMAQLYAHRPDLKIESIRGNVDTRIRKLEAGHFDAIVLAAAGLNRLGWSDRIAEYIPVEVVCPAVGQGALAIETRDDGGEGMLACLALNHVETNAATRAERGVLEMLGGGCQVPVGAYATISRGTLHLRAIVIAPDGTGLILREADGPMADAVRIGNDVGRELLESGGREILKSVAE